MAPRQSYLCPEFYVRSSRSQSPSCPNFDFLVSHDGAIWTFYPRSEAAQAWWAEHIDIKPWQRVGRRHAVDHRLGPGLVRLLESAGFLVGGGNDA